jgi:hypothetical protein
LKAGGWSKSTPDWHKSFVEAKWSFAFKNFGKAINESIVNLFVSFDWLIHKSCSNNIKWGNSDSHEETSNES